MIKKLKIKKKYSLLFHILFYHFTYFFFIIKLLKNMNLIFCNNLQIFHSPGLEPGTFGFISGLASHWNNWDCNVKALNCLHILRAMAEGPKHIHFEIRRILRCCYMFLGVENRVLMVKTLNSGGGNCYKHFKWL